MTHAEWCSSRGENCDFDGMVGLMGCEDCAKLWKASRKQAIDECLQIAKDTDCEKCKRLFPHKIDGGCMINCEQFIEFEIKELTKPEGGG